MSRSRTMCSVSSAVLSVLCLGAVWCVLYTFEGFHLLDWLPVLVPFSRLWWCVAVVALLISPTWILIPWWRWFFARCYTDRRASSAYER